MQAQETRKGDTNDQRALLVWKSKKGETEFRERVKKSKNTGRTTPKKTEKPSRRKKNVKT